MPPCHSRLSLSGRSSYSSQIPAERLKWISGAEALFLRALCGTAETPRLNGKCATLACGGLGMATSRAQTGRNPCPTPLSIEGEDRQECRSTTTGQAFMLCRPPYRCCGLCVLASGSRGKEKRDRMQNLEDLEKPLRELHAHFANLSEPHRPSLWRYCLRLIGSPWDAEDRRRRP